MATNAKTTTRKTRLAAPAKATRSTSVRTTVRQQKVHSIKDWFTTPVFSPKTSLGALFAELIGTFVLASVVLTTKGSAIVLAFALIGIVFATYKLSGAHLNPALSIAAWATRKITGWRALGYVVAQVLGAMLALLVANWLLSIAPAESSSAFSQAAPATIYHIGALTADKEWFIFWAQMLGTAVFGFAVANLWNGRKNADGGVGAALTYGFGFYAALILGGTFAVLNPAVAIAIGGVQWSVWPLAVYVAAPIIGAIVGAGLYKLFNEDVESAAKAV